jgi:hypothetical protein
MAGGSGGGDQGISIEDDAMTTDDISDLLKRVSTELDNNDSSNNALELLAECYVALCQFSIIEIKRLKKEGAKS